MFRLGIHGRMEKIGVDIAPYLPVSVWWQIGEKAEDVTKYAVQALNILGQLMTTILDIVFQSEEKEKVSGSLVFFVFFSKRAELFGTPCREFQRVLRVTLLH